jgi:hypothetical protein
MLFRAHTGHIACPSRGEFAPKVLKLWCCRKGLNFRPPPYQGGALPLSYGSLGLLRSQMGITRGPGQWQARATRRIAQ